MYYNMCTICFSVFVVRKFVTDINSYSVATRVPSQRPAKRVTHWPLNGFDEKQFVGLVRFCGVPQRSSKATDCEQEVLAPPGCPVSRKNGEQDDNSSTVTLTGI